jgi:hypothetical protein
MTWLDLRADIAAEFAELRAAAEYQIDIVYERSAARERARNSVRRAWARQETAARRPRACKRCGEPLPQTPLRGRPKTYCSPACQRVADRAAFFAAAEASPLRTPSARRMAEIFAARPHALVSPRPASGATLAWPCSICAGPLVAPARGPLPTMCSRDCRDLDYQRRRKQTIDAGGLCAGGCGAARPTGSKRCGACREGDAARQRRYEEHRRQARQTVAQP